MLPIRTAVRVALLLLTAGWILPAPAQNALTLEVGRWEATPGGRLSAGAAGVAGDEVDVDQDLGFDESEQVWQGSACIGTVHQVCLSYLDLGFQGRLETEEDFLLGATEYPAGTALRSALDVQAMGGGYRYASGGDNWASGFQLELQWVELELVASELDGPKERNELRQALPVVGFFADWKPAFFLSLGGILRFGAWDWQESSLTLVDAQASARLLFHPFILGGGYRYLALQGDDTSQPMEVDLSFSGPVLYAGLTF